MKAFLRLVPYMKPYTLFIILAPLLMCFEVIMDLLQPALMQHIIDTGIANEDNAYVMKLGFFMLLSAFLGLLGGMGCVFFSAKAAVNFATDIRRDVFRKTTQFSSQNTDSFGIGKLITIVTNDLSTVQHAFMMTLRVFVRGPLLFIGSVLIVWFTARELFPVLLVAIPILIVLIYFFSVKTGKLYGKVQQAVDKVNTKLQETLSGIRVIKAFGRQSFEKSQFQNYNDQLTKRNLTAEQVIFTLMPLMTFIVNIALVAGLWLGAIKVNEGTLQIGVILAFINYLNIILNGLVSSSNVLMQITRSFPSAKRIVQVLECDVDIKGPESPVSVPEIRGEVEFNAVTFRYFKEHEPVLDNISFHVKPGEKIGIIGSTGSGKSTLMKLIPRLYDPDEGEILIDGVNIKDYSLEPLRSQIGFVPQKALLFSGTIADNLRFGKEDATLAEMEEAADTAAANEFIERLEKGFSHELLQGATNLSGGQKQRLSMARAFIRQPKILILDDSTSAIDAISEARVQKALREGFPDTTVFIISTKISSIIHADQIFVLDNGKIETKGTHEELLKKSRVYQEIYATQSGKEMAVNE